MVYKPGIMGSFIQRTTIFPKQADFHIFINILFTRNSVGAEVIHVIIHAKVISTGAYVGIKVPAFLFLVILPEYNTEPVTVPGRERGLLVDVVHMLAPAYLHAIGSNDDFGATPVSVVLDVNAVVGIVR